MATYKGIKGFTIQSFSTDPYTSVAGSGTWASGGVLNTGRFPIGGATNAPATSTGLGFGGTAPGPAKTGKTESYDGTSWTEKGDLNDARIAMSGAGTATAALGFGGDSPGYPTATESFNGTSWTVVPATLTQGKDSAAGFGLQTAAIFATGYAGPPAGPTGNTNKTDSYNGSAWSEVADVNTKRSYVYGCGIQTSGIIAGGSGPPYSAAAETWNGTCWTTVNSINTARANFAMFGVQTFAVGSGGDDGSTPRFALVEAYDGTTWTEVANLASANKMSASSGTGGSAGINFGGSDPGNNPMTRTEEWTTASPPISIAQVGQVWYNTTSNVMKGLALATSTGAWSSAPSINTGRNNVCSCGTQTAALLSLGEGPYADKNKTEEYNGSAWSETNDANTERQSGAGFGTQTAGVDVGGHDAPNTASVATEEYDGSCWTTVNNCNTGGQQGGAAGILTAGMWFGRYTWPSPGVRDVSETYDGTTWTEGNNLTTARYGNVGAGSTTAAITVGGTPSAKDETEIWDGTSWSETNDLNTARNFGSGSSSGTTTAMLLAGGGPGHKVVTEGFDGTSWTEVGDLATAKIYSGGAGTSGAMISYAGSAPPYILTTEEWNATGGSVKTFTSS